MKKDPRTRIRSHLKTLKLHHMGKILDEELDRANREKLSPAELLDRLLSLEAQRVLERRIERRIKESKLPERKLLADFDFDFQTGVDKAQIMELSTLGFVERKQSLVLAGDSGTGKSHIAKALLLIGCRQCYRCRYTTASDMLKDGSIVWNRSRPVTLLCFSRSSTADTARLQQSSQRMLTSKYSAITWVTRSSQRPSWTGWSITPLLSVSRDRAGEYTSPRCSTSDPVANHPVTRNSLWRGVVSSLYSS